MSENELREYFNIFTECGWKLFKKYSNPVDDQKFWDALVNETEELIKKSKKPEAARQVALVVHKLVRAVHESK